MQRMTRSEMQKRPGQDDDDYEGEESSSDGESPASRSDDKGSGDPGSGLSSDGGSFWAGVDPRLARARAATPARAPLVSHRAAPHASHRRRASHW